MLKVTDDYNGYESGYVWIPQWYEKEHLEEFIGKSITDEDWEGFLDWKNDVIPDMRYEICEDYEYYAEGRSEDE